MPSVLSAVNVSVVQLQVSGETNIVILLGRLNRDKMGGESGRSTNGEDTKCVRKFSFLNVKKSDLLADIGVYGSTVLIIEDAGWIKLACGKVRLQDFVNFGFNGNTKESHDHFSKYMYFFKGYLALWN